MECSVNFGSHLFQFGWLSVQAAPWHPDVLHVGSLPSITSRMAQVWEVLCSVNVHNPLWHFKAPVRAENLSGSSVSGGAESKGCIMAPSSPDTYFSSADLAMSVEPFTPGACQGRQIDICRKQFILLCYATEGAQMQSKTRLCMSEVRWDKFNSKHSAWDQQNSVFLPAEQCPGTLAKGSPVSCLTACLAGVWGQNIPAAEEWLWEVQGFVLRQMEFHLSEEVIINTEFPSFGLFFRVKSWADAFGGELYSIVTKYSGSLLLQKVGKIYEGSLCFVSPPHVPPKVSPRVEQRIRPWCAAVF